MFTTSCARRRRWEAAGKHLAVGSVDDLRELVALFDLRDLLDWRRVKVVEPFDGELQPVFVRIPHRRRP
jgi:hypothetical protein